VDRWTRLSHRNVALAGGSCVPIKINALTIASDTGAIKIWHIYALALRTCAAKVEVGNIRALLMGSYMRPYDIGNIRTSEVIRPAERKGF
jgi:hypothetical protein